MVGGMVGDAVFFLWQAHLAIVAHFGCCAGVDIWMCENLRSNTNARRQRRRALDTNHFVVAVPPPLPPAEPSEAGSDVAGSTAPDLATTPHAVLDQLREALALAGGTGLPGPGSGSESGDPLAGVVVHDVFTMPPRTPAADDGQTGVLPLSSVDGDGFGLVCRQCLSTSPLNGAGYG